MEILIKFVVTIFLRIRWNYFKFHPNYIPFTVDKKKSNEMYFQHRKTGIVYYDYYFKDNKEV